MKTHKSFLSTKINKYHVSMWKIFVEYDLIISRKNSIRPGCCRTDNPLKEFTAEILGLVKSRLVY